MTPCHRCGIVLSEAGRCRTCHYITPLLGALVLLGACGHGAVTLDDSGAEVIAIDDTGADLPDPVDVASLGDTRVQDWMPMTTGNWPNALTDDACNSPDGPVCYDCYHVPTGTYARWFRVDEDGGYASDDWFGATLGQLVFEDFDAESGSGLDSDGAYYAFDTMAACAPVYWLLGGE